jgi:IS4 transposase
MFKDQMLELFSVESPVPVMVRGVLENILGDDRLNRIFEESAERQYCRELTFAMCVELMADVVAKIRPSINAAYAARKDVVPVSVTSVYNKLNGIEPVVCEQLVKRTAADMGAVIDELGSPRTKVLSGWDVRIVDGNHLAGTDHRIKELRRLGAAALPGQTLPILDPQREIIEDVIACENGHTNERVLIPQILERMLPRQCWIADAKFCTLNFLFGARKRRTHVIVRHHGSLHGELTGRRRKIGRCATGVVYEQTLVITHKGQQMDLRRITIKRKTPTKKGELEVHILTTLPKSVSGIKIAGAYKDRWKIETAFQDVTTTLRCEIATLGHPGAALFGFCMASVIYNVLSVVKAALRAGSSEVIETNLSMYALADEISGVWRGMLIAVPADAWSDFEAKTTKQLACTLKALAKNAAPCALTNGRLRPSNPNESLVTEATTSQRKRYSTNEKPAKRDLEKAGRAPHGHTRECRTGTLARPESTVGGKRK